MRLLIVLLLAATTFAADDDFLRTCMTGMLLEPVTNTPFVCLGSKGKAPHLKPGYSVDKAIGLMLDREDNAWKQLRNIADLQERLGFAILLAERGRTEYAKSPRAHDITDVSIGRTTDSREIVIQLKTADGRKASLWLDGGDDTKPLRVRSVTPY